LFLIEVVQWLYIDLIVPDGGGTMCSTIFTLQDSHVILALVISLKIKPTKPKSGEQSSPTVFKAANNILLTAHIATMAENAPKHPLLFEWARRSHLTHIPSTCDCDSDIVDQFSPPEESEDGEMVGKKSGKALLREEGMIFYHKHHFYRSLPNPQVWRVQTME
jgi:hypothetical protein